MQFWQSVFWFSACVGCAALAAAIAVISTLACDADDLSLGEAVRGGVLCGLGLALVVLLFKTFVEFFVTNAVQILEFTLVVCVLGFGLGILGCVKVCAEEGRCPRRGDRLLDYLD